MIRERSRCQRGYGATAVRLTPDQKVGSSNLSGLNFCTIRSAQPAQMTNFHAFFSARLNVHVRPQPTHAYCVGSSPVVEAFQCAYFESMSALPAS